MSDELAVLRVSAPRRIFAIGVMVILAGLLLSVASVRPPDDALWRGFLAVLGGAILALGEAMRRATARSLRLTRDGLFDSTGRELARMDEITRVERGAFALKPSNGFTVLLAAGRPPVWVPGVWWRIGRRIGVGGVTSAIEARAMADILAAALVERDRAREAGAE
ncbi:hypothetical protein [Rhodovulum steppense]|uniref:Uncharacterized protein n=1 Tax=Rhodovulum steppense TaxID=540251 RepID=A0A4R1Z3Q2_9RHOB|nr:hypothetical protein [Rhodovulum steppense]TCM88086.1 hypothetical protein EV216_10196 [Rhodovulum steppense]